MASTGTGTYIEKGATLTFSAGADLAEGAEVTLIINGVEQAEAIGDVTIDSANKTTGKVTITAKTKVDVYLDGVKQTLTQVPGQADGTMGMFIDDMNGKTLAFVDDVDAETLDECSSGLTAGGTGEDGWYKVDSTHVQGGKIQLWRAYKITAPADASAYTLYSDSSFTTAMTANSKAFVKADGNAKIWVKAAEKNAEIILADENAKSTMSTDGEGGQVPNAGKEGIWVVTVKEELGASAFEAGVSFDATATNNKVEIGKTDGVKVTGTELENVTAVQITGLTLREGVTVASVEVTAVGKDAGSNTASDIKVTIADSNDATKGMLKFTAKEAIAGDTSEKAVCTITVTLSNGMRCPGIAVTIKNA